MTSEDLDVVMEGTNLLIGGDKPYNDGTQCASSGLRHRSRSAVGAGSYIALRKI